MAAPALVGGEAGGAARVERRADCRGCRSGALDRVPQSGHVSDERAAGLLAREHKGGHPPTLGAADQAAFLEQPRVGKFRRAKEAQAWTKARTQRTLALSSVYSLLGKVGGVLKVPRKTHAKKDAAAAESFKATLADKLAAISAKAEGRALRL